MTGPRSDMPSRRVEDKTRLGRFVAWWRSYGQLVMGVGLAVVAIGCGTTAVFVYRFSKERAQDAQIVRRLTEISAKQQAATAVAARAACERSKQFGPTLLDDYERRHVFPANVIAEYRAAIPKTCPTK